MARTPGLIIPSAYPSTEAFTQDLRRRSKAAGFTQFDISDFIDATIEHHGVKGMHWGVRRSRAQLDAASADFQTTSAHRSKAREAGGTHALSNQELQTVITRLNLEQQYNRLTYEPSKLEKGQKAIKEILGVGKTVQEVHSFVNGPLGKSVKNELKKNRQNNFANNRGLGS